MTPTHARVHDSRRLEREAASVADKLWPPSPDAPYRSPSPPPRRHKSDGKSRHKHKHKKGSGKSKSSSKRDSKHHKSSTSKRHHHRRSKEDVSAAARGDSESDDRGSVASSVVSSSRKRARTSRRRSRSVASSRSRSSVSRSSSRSRSPRRDGATGASIAPVAATDDADMWVEKKVGGIAGEEQEVVGPRPLFVPDASKAIGYGAALLPGYCLCSMLSTTFEMIGFKLRAHAHAILLLTVRAQPWQHSYKKASASLVVVKSA